jgi:hypothetical protein
MLTTNSASRTIVRPLFLNSFAMPASVVCGGVDAALAGFVPAPGVRPA